MKEEINNNDNGVHKTSDEDCIICQGKILNYYTNKIIVEDSWKQVILRKNEQTKSA